MYTIIIGRTLGAETLGEVSSLLALAVFVSLFWPTACGVAASRFIPRDRILGRSPSPTTAIITRSFFRSLPVLAVVTFGLALLISEDPVAAAAAVILMCTYSSYVFTRGAALGENKFLRIATLDTLSALASILLLSLVVVGEWHWATLLPLSLGYALFAAFSWPRSASNRTSQRSEVRNFVGLNSVAQIATGGLLQVAMLAAALSDDAYQAGIFAVALSLATPASMIGQSLNQVLIPHFAGMADRGVSLVTGSTRRITLVAAVGLGAVFGVLFLLAPWVINVLYGANFEEAAGYMRALIVGVYVFSVSLVSAAALVATDRERKYTVASVVGFVTGVITMLVVAAIFGAWGAAVGFIAGTVVSGGLTVLWGTTKLGTARATSVDPQ